MLIMFLRMSEQGDANASLLKYDGFLDVFLIVNALECRWVIVEVLDKVSPGSVNWKQATKPPIKMPFRKVENCNQVIRIGKDLNFSLVNVAGNDIVQGNKKLILGNPFLFFLSFFSFLDCKTFCKVCLLHLREILCDDVYDIIEILSFQPAIKPHLI